MRVCAIHQPNFFPWLGYFDKIRRSDVFVFLDAVDYPRAGSGGMGSWTNRVKVDQNGEGRWFKAPMQKQKRATLINESWIAADPKWRIKAVRSLQNAYAKARNVEAAMKLLEPLLMNDNQNIATYNMTAIRAISEALGLKERFVVQSELGTEKSSTDLLIEIVQSLKCDAYLAGGGASGYQEDSKFSEAGVELIYQDFQPSNYKGTRDFIPGLSVIDYLMWAPDWAAFAEGEA